LFTAAMWLQPNDIAAVVTLAGRPTRELLLELALRMPRVPWNVAGGPVSIGLRSADHRARGSAEAFPATCSPTGSEVNGSMQQLNRRSIGIGAMS
jgi:hypothetical protein